ncbi:MAG TPA: polysaccharide deacetylase family protein [Gaiellaceae bacterium]|nr:polysaccharide deacetylase family protein [Gaiellaceae bacterium]
MDAKRAVRDALIGAAAPVAELTFRERPRIRVLAFHDTPPDQEGELRDRLRRLADRSAVVPLADAFERTQLDGERLNVVLTFDDGLKEHHGVAARVLDELGLPGTFFVPTGALDLEGEAAADFSRRGLRRSRTFEFMSSRDVRELAGHALFEVGGHTHSHPDLGASDDLDAEVAEPKEVLERLTGNTVRWFAYPFGSPLHLSARSVDAIRLAGYETAFTIVPAFWSTSTDPFLVGRDALSLHDSARSWEGFLRGGYDALSAFKYRKPLAELRAR